MAATSKDGPELHTATVELAQGRNYGAITTVLPSGRLQTHPIWVGTDGERLVVNTETHRQKYMKTESQGLPSPGEDEPLLHQQGAPLSILLGCLAPTHPSVLVPGYVLPVMSPEPIST